MRNGVNEMASRSKTATSSREPKKITLERALQRVRGTYKEVSPRRRLVYTNLADFIPGVEPYEITMVVELYVVPHGVRMVLTQDAMHDAQWTKLATMGWESELGKLAKLLERRYPARATKRKAPRK
jgi:uncharacterized protein YndB with AHSA1/START domain